MFFIQDLLESNDLVEVLALFLQLVQSFDGVFGPSKAQQDLGLCNGKLEVFGVAISAVQYAESRFIVAQYWFEKSVLQLLWHFEFEINDL